MAFVKEISDQFVIPQFGETRRVFAVLPDDYDNSDKRYPVLYLQDGQNLVEPGNGFGSWRLLANMKTLESSGGQVPIIIGIHHGGKTRIKDYSPRMPWTKTEVRGFEYLQFVTKTLKPFIDKTLRTDSSRNATGIGGSSMGGLVSIYAASIYPEIFSKYLIFSPSIWLRPSFSTNPNLFLKLSQARFYIYSGKKESKTLEKYVVQLRDMLKKFKKNEEVNVRLSLKSDGTHQEKYWAAEINKAIKWLY